MDIAIALDFVTKSVKSPSGCVCVCVWTLSDRILRKNSGKHLVSRKNGIFFT